MDAAKSFCQFLDADALLRTSMIAGHRGLEKTCLENSLSGMIAAYDAGADAVETDIHPTKDGRLVVMHDEDLRRTTDGAGNVSDLTLEEIRRYVIDYPKAVGKKERIPTLDDFFEELQKRDKVLIVELKDANANTVPLLKELLQKYDVADKIVLISFFANQLTAARALLPEVAVGNLSFKGCDVADTAKFGALTDEIAAKDTRFAPQYQSVDAAALRALFLRGIGAYAWTFGDEGAMASAWNAGFASLTTSDAAIASGWASSIRDCEPALRAGIAARPVVTIDTKAACASAAAELTAVEDGWLTQTEDGYLAQAAGRFAAYVKYRYQGNGFCYTLYRKTNVCVTAAYGIATQSEIAQIAAPADAFAGDLVEFRVDVPQGFELALAIRGTDPVDWTETDGVYSFVMPDCAVTITANAQALAYAIGTDAEQAGTDLPREAKTGERVAFSVAPDRERKVERVFLTVGDEQTELYAEDGIYSFVMPAGPVAVRVVTAAVKGCNAGIGSSFGICGAGLVFAAGLMLGRKRRGAEKKEGSERNR